MSTTPFFQSIFFRLLLAFTAVAAGPLLVSGIIEYNAGVKRDEDAAAERIRQQVSFVDQAFDTQVSQRLGARLRSLSRSRAVDSFLLASETIKVLLVSDLEGLFQRETSEIREFQTISLVNRHGLEEARVVEGRRSREYRNLGAAVTQTDPTAAAAQAVFRQLRVEGVQGVVTVGPIRTADGHIILVSGISRTDPNTGGFGCAVLIEYRLDQFLNDLSALRFHGVPAIWVYDEKGTTFLEPPSSVPRLDPRENAPSLELVTRDSGVAMVSPLSVAQAPSTIRAAVSVPSAVFRRDVRSTAILLLQILGLGFILAAGLAIVLSRFMARPIVRLSEATHGVAEGDLSLSVDVEGAGELRVLGESFNTMVSTLNTKQQELIRASRFKTQFLANMSHELRTPLNAVIGFTGIVLRKAGDDLDERQRRNLEMVLASGEHLLEMVNDLLDIERIEAGMVRVSPVAVDCVELAEDLRARYERDAAREHRQFRVTAERDLALRTDPVRLRQILDNLITNAFKYSTEGDIELSIQRTNDGSSIAFAVRDHGEGVPPEHMDKIFEPFHQVKSGASGSGGVGLGLHLVTRLTELLGGRISAESAVGRGSTFTVTLPVGEDVRLPRAKDHEARHPVGVGRNIVVIDDDAEALQILSTELVDAGYRVHAANSGQAGLEMVRELRPDAIVLDIVMPGLDGWGVLKALRQDPDLSDIPVVIASLLDQAPRAHELGIAAWLTKPVRAAEFREVFRRIGVEPHDDVLVVEDNAETVELMEQTLAELEVEVRVARDGKQAVQALEERMPRVVVLDLLLPEMDGFEVLARLRKLPGGPEVSIIVYTGKDLTAAERKRLNHGFVEVIQKAGNGVATVSAAVRRVLRLEDPR